MKEDDIVVEIRGGSRPPLWLLHPIGGNVLYAHAFATGLAREQPVLALQARGLNGRSAPFISVIDAASFYLRIIRARQARGPYFLAGPSFGGTVAYEMACMLEAQGDSVGLVALLDSFGPNYPRPAPLLDVLRVRGHSFLARAKRLVARGRLGPAAGDARLPLGEDAAVYALARIPSGHSESVKTLQRVSLAHQHALKTYRQSHYHGRVHLFRAEERPERFDVLFDNPTNGWDSVVHGGVDVTVVPGTHQFMLDPPSVDYVVATLDRLLRDTVPTRVIAPAPMARGS